MHSVLPFSLFLLAIFGFAATAFLSRRSTAKTARSIESLLESFEPVDTDGVCSVAHDYLEPHRGQVSMEPEVIWQMLGGEVGLRRMSRNADLLLALASHASEWNDEEGMIVAERMRRDALRLRRAVRQVRLGMLSQVITGHHWISVPFQLQEAASAYYLMRQRLLALFETSHSALVPALSAAL